MATTTTSHSRLRSASDPFSDPDQTHKNHRRSNKAPPAPPPKAKKMSSTSTTTTTTTPIAPRSAPPHRSNHIIDIAEAVRDTVTLRGADNPRHRVARSQTAITPIPTNTRQPPLVSRRSHSQDSHAAVVEKASKHYGKHRSKKDSNHADVIDRLDFTAGGPRFHHDGPFDACAPSRNRHHTKAPILALSNQADDLTSATALNENSPYPSRDAYKAFSEPYEPQKKKVDAMAEAWGIHEPEPYEEFFAAGGRPDGDTPTSSIYRGKESNASSRHGHGHPKRSTNNAKEMRDAYRNEGRDPKRSTLPPPQPIFVPESEEALDSDMPLAASGGSPGSRPKRSKSLMQKIRKMRDSPNIPVSSDYYDAPPSPPSSGENTVQVATGATPRPTHRSQNSFLGRFTRKDGGGPSPTLEQYPYAEDQAKTQEKELPATPYGTSSPPEFASSQGNFDSQERAQGQGIGRKQSLLKKVGRVVRGNR